MEQYLIGFIIIGILVFFIGIPSIMFCYTCNQKRKKYQLNYDSKDYCGNNSNNKNNNNIEHRKSLLAVSNTIA
jgi:hypothetical protein